MRKEGLMNGLWNGVHPKMALYKFGIFSAIFHSILIPITKKTIPQKMKLFFLLFLIAVAISAVISITPPLGDGSPRGKRSPTPPGVEITGPLEDISPRGKRSPTPPGVEITGPLEDISPRGKRSPTPPGVESEQQPRKRSPTPPGVESPQ